MADRRCLQAGAPCTCGMRALVVDNDPVYRSIHRGYLRDWGFEVSAVEGQGDALMQAAMARAAEMRCHIAVIDMRLVDDEDRSDQSGLLLARQLKQRAGLRTIIVTGYGTMEAARFALRESGVFDIIGKEEGPKRLEEVVRAAADVFCRSDFSIHWPARWNAARVAAELVHEGETVDDGETLDVLSLLFPDARKVILEWLDGAAATDSQSSNYRRSVVFLAHEDRKQPVILKLMRAGKARRERDNYTNVEGYLGGLRRASLLSAVEWWHLSGITYTLLGQSYADAQRPLRTFSRFYRAEPTAAPVNNVLRPHFVEVWGRLLNPGQAADLGCGRAIETSLFAEYVARREGSAYGDQLLARWSQKWATQEFTFQTETGSAQVVVPDAQHWLFLHHTLVLPNAERAYVHGDLHGDNLLVDERETAWSIDFGRTRCAHALTDFGQLTQNILTRLAILPDDNHLLLYHLAIALCALRRSVDEPLRMTTAVAGDSEATKALLVVSELCKVAREVTHFTDLREFLWSILLDCAIVAEIVPAEEARYQKLMLLGGIICRRLELHAAVWPPPEWPTVSWQPDGTGQDCFKLLFLASNLGDARTLRLETEIRRVDEHLQRSENRSRFRLEKEFPADAVQLSEYLQRYKPQLVHFGGHGDSEGGIRLAGSAGRTEAVPASALRQIFRFYTSTLRCVVLNACYTETQAAAIAEHIDVVIGMSTAVSDEAAIRFAEGLYQKIFAGWSVKDAFDHGCAIVDASRLQEQDRPQLRCLNHDPAQIRFV